MVPKFVSSQSYVICCPIMARATLVASSCMRNAFGSIRLGMISLFVWALYMVMKVVCGARKYSGTSVNGSCIANESLLEQYNSVSINFVGFVFG